MTFARSALAAAAFSMIAITAPAMAADTVLVVNPEAVYAQSLAGKDAQTKLKGIAEGIKKELEPEAKVLETEGAGLDARFKGKTNQQKLEELQKDAALQGKYKTFQQKLGALAQKEDLRNAELQATQNKAINEVWKNAIPIVDEIRTQRGAAVVLDAREAVSVAPAADITKDVIAKLDGKVKAIAVAKVDLSKQAQPK